MDEEGVFMMMSKSSASAGGGPKCGRWNPTPEQVKVLTDLFRSGLRTPTTDQIQKISLHLSSFGKIESKNVFYWFQNHKARERHHSKKRRRQSPPSTQPSSPSPDHNAVTRTTTEEAAAAATRSMACGIGGEEGEIETLELFPLSSYNEPLRIARNNHKDTAAAFMCAGKDFLLDLRLSSL